MHHLEFRSPPAAAVFQTKSATTQGRSLQSLLASLCVGGAIFLGEILLFLVLRAKFPNIYRHQIDSGGAGNKSVPVRSDDLEIIIKCGLDAYLFLRYLRLLLVVFVPLAILILPVLLPVNLTSGDSLKDEITGLDRLSWINVAPNHTIRYWVHMSMALCVVLWVAYVFAREMQFYTRLRQHSIATSQQSGLFGTTVLITDIPPHLRDVSKLKTLYSVYPGGVSNVILNRKYDSLLTKISRRDQLIGELESAETRLIRRANLRWQKYMLVNDHLHNNSSSSKAELTPPEFVKPSDRKTMAKSRFSWIPFVSLVVDSEDVINYCRTEVDSLNRSILQEKANPKTFDIVSSAFVQFHEPRGAHMASQCILHPQPRTMIASYVPEAASQIVWKHIALDWWERCVRSHVVKCLILAFCTSCILPVAFTGLLSQINYLHSFFPWLGWVTNLPTWFLSLIQGALPPCLLAVVMILSPIILRLLVAEQGEHTQTAVELSMQRYYFIFLFLQLFVVVSISSSAAAVLNGLTQNFKSVATLITSNLPKAGNYFFSYMLLQGLSVSATTLLQLNRIFTQFTAYFYDDTARQQWTRNQETEISWGSYFPVYTNLAVIGIIYSVVSPLILIFNIFAFALFYAVQRYNILNVSKSNLDTGGLVYPEALNQLFVGLYVMEIYLIGLFSLVRDGQNRAACPGQAIIMTIVALLTIVYQRIVNQGYQSHFQHLPICDAKEVNKDSAMPKFKTNSWTSDFLDKSFLINRAGGILRFFVVEDTLKMLETARISVAGQQRSSWSSRVTNIDSFNAMPEAIQKNPPTIWLPKDNLGMSTHEIHKTHQSSATISISDENAFLGPDAKVSYVDGPPAPS